MEQNETIITIMCMIVKLDCNLRLVGRLPDWAQCITKNIK